MTTLTLYHLTPQSGFHLGQRGVGLEETGVHLPSDTLFSAMITTQVETGGLISDLTGYTGADQNKSETLKVPYLLTSAFPRAGQVRFYPVPALNLLRLASEQREQRLKELKAIQFVSEAIFEKIVAGAALDEWLPPSDETAVTADDQGLYLQNKSLWLSAAELDQLPQTMQQKGPKSQQYRAIRNAEVWHTGKVPRVTVDRQVNASNIFHIGRLTFSSGCGWWFGLAWQQTEPAIQQRVTETLQMLVDVGLGGERAAGYGQFSCQLIGPKTWPDPAPGNLFITLSRYHPQPDELPDALRDDPVAYKLVSVGGWLQTQTGAAQRRRRLWLLAEGSAVRAIGAGPWGDIIDVRPIYPGGNSTFPHPVWRYGLACPVALKGEA